MADVETATVDSVPSTVAAPVAPRSRAAEAYRLLYPFQQELFDAAVRGNAIVFLPTGAGKTVLASAIAARLHRDAPQMKVVFLVNRIPLVRQQALVLRRFAGLRVAEVCGERKDVTTWAGLGADYDAVVIIAGVFFAWTLDAPTAAAIIRDTSLVVFDEVHHARGGSDYARLAPLLTQGPPPRPQILGLSASPGADLDPQKTRDDIERLMVLLDSIVVAVREHTADLAARVPVPAASLAEYQPSPPELELERTVLGALRRVERHVKQYKPIARSLQCTMPARSTQYLVECRTAAALGTAEDDPLLVHTARTVMALNLSLALLQDLGVPQAAHKLLTFAPGNRPWFEFAFPRRGDFSAVTWRDAAGAGCVSDRQGGLFFEALWREVVGVCGAVSQLVRARLPGLLGPGRPPQQATSMKFRALEHLLAAALEPSDDGYTEADFRGIVFCQTKAATYSVARQLSLSTNRRVSALCPQYFVGHSKTPIEDEDVSLGMSERQQQDRLAAFRAGTCRLLVATSVVEEGLDVQVCSFIVRYDGDFTLQSYIQSRGRARRRNSVYYALARRDGEASEFTKAAEAVAMQDAIVRDITATDQRALLDQAKRNAAVAAARTPAWGADALAAVQLLSGRVDMRVQQSIQPDKLGKSVRLNVVWQKEAGAAPVQVQGVGRAQEQRAKRLAADIACTKLQDEGFDWDGALRGARQKGIPTVEVHGGSAAATLRGLNPREVTILEQYRLLEYDPAVWAGAKRRPFELLDATLKSKGAAAPVVEWADPAEAGHYHCVLRYPVVHPDGATRWWERRHEAPVRSVALHTAALRALEDAGAPQVRVDA